MSDQKDQILELCIKIGETTEVCEFLLNFVSGDLSLANKLVNQYWRYCRYNPKISLKRFLIKRTNLTADERLKELGFTRMKELENSGSFVYSHEYYVLRIMFNIITETSHFIFIESKFSLETEYLEMIIEAIKMKKKELGWNEM